MPESHWLTLGQASELLGVHPTTLRSWADTGLVHAFFTPGGHRRFQTQELASFLKRHRGGNTIVAELESSEQTLTLVREQLGTQLAEQPAWYHEMNEEQRVRYRTTGRRLLDLFLQYLSRVADESDILELARAIARSDGREFAQRGYSITDLTQAFVTLRRIIIYATYKPVNDVADRDSHGSHLLERINSFFDELLIATLGSYELAKPNEHAQSKKNKPLPKIAGASSR